MTRKTLTLVALLMAVPVLSGCALAVGAGAAVVADQVAEENGRNLF
ncbi:MAG: hypothetical protein AAGF30_12700 [Pseudomonadota bacterium]